MKTLLIILFFFLISCSTIQFKTTKKQKDFPQTLEEAEAYIDSLINEPIKSSNYTYR